MATIVQNVTGFLYQVREKIGGGAPSAGVRLGERFRRRSELGPGQVGHGQASRRVRAAQQYMQYRMQGRVDDLMRLVGDDIVLESSRDGKVFGRPGFEKYVRRVKPTGTWQAAGWNDKLKQAEIRGIVKIVMVSVRVQALFGFDNRGKINRIYVGTKKGDS